jgi:hypothetical protein
MGTSIRVGVSLRPYRSSSVGFGDSPLGSTGETSTTIPMGAEPGEIIVAVHVEEVSHRPRVAGLTRALLRAIVEAVNLVSRIAAALLAWFGG